MFKTMACLGGFRRGRAATISWTPVSHELVLGRVLAVERCHGGPLVTTPAGLGRSRPRGIGVRSTLRLIGRERFISINSPL
jgi:hypothetical protein